MPLEILIVDDNECDVWLIRVILGQVNETARLHVVTDGFDAMQFLAAQGRYADAPRPDLMLLDLALPRMHGRIVLARIKANPQLQTIPVIVMTSSRVESDLVTCYQLKANAYLRKPDDLNDFEALVRSLNDFWLTSVEFAKKEQRAGPYGNATTCDPSA
ncbi:MAG TPA: response regulator [Terriglobales bacterium]|nr:response regulator [Terriglobales bacterium]